MARQPSGSRPSHNLGFEITFRHTTPGRTPPDEWSARRRDLSLTTHNTHKRQKRRRRDSNPPSQKAKTTNRRLRLRGNLDRLSY